MKVLFAFLIVALGAGSVMAQHNGHWHKKKSQCKTTCTKDKCKSHSHTKCDKHYKKSSTCKTKHVYYHSPKPKKPSYTWKLVFGKHGWEFVKVVKHVPPAAPPLHCKDARKNNRDFCKKTDCKVPQCKSARERYYEALREERRQRYFEKLREQRRAERRAYWSKQRECNNRYSTFRRW